MITLYHGSNELFDVPDPSRGRRGTDGQGFYLTPDFDSAAGVAGLSVMRSGCGRKIVLCYDFDEDRAIELGLRRRSFGALDAEWMSFIIANRMADRTAEDHNVDCLYDVVDGLVADDKIVMLLRRYQRGELTQDDILGILRQRPWRTVQYSFHSRKAIMCLSRKEVVYVD
mgnify:CR=1 FL=1